MNLRGADIVICDFVWNNQVMGLDYRSYSSVDALREMANDRIELAVWNKLYKREIWDGIRFPVGHNYEGMRTTYKLIEKAKKIQQIPDCLMLHRTREGSIVQTQSLKNSLDYILACNEYEKYVIGNTPFVFSIKNRNQMLERRFDEKLMHWFIIDGIKPAIAKRLRMRMLRLNRYTTTWRIRNRLKFILFGVSPVLLRVCISIKRKVFSFVCNLRINR